MPETAAGRALERSLRDDDGVIAPTSFVESALAYILAIEREARALGRAEALADLRARLDAATDLGLYPLGGVRKATAAEPAWQEGWNAAMIAMAEAEDKFWDGLAAIDNLETPE